MEEKCEHKYRLFRMQTTKDDRCLSVLFQINSQVCFCSQSLKVFFQYHLACNDLILILPNGVLYMHESYRSSSHFYLRRLYSYEKILEAKIKTQFCHNFHSVGRNWTCRTNRSPTVSKQQQYYTSFLDSRGKK